MQRARIDHVEVHALDCCNFNCRNCSHFAYLAPRKLYLPEDYAGSLQQLSEYCITDEIRLLGGEPFLHPGIADFYEVMAQSSILSESGYVNLVTNGYWLECWEQYVHILKRIKHLSITIYPRMVRKLGEQRLQTILSAVQHVVGLLVVWPRGTFSSLEFTEQPHQRAEPCRSLECLSLDHLGRLHRCHVQQHIRFRSGADAFKKAVHRYVVAEGSYDTFVNWLNTAQEACMYCTHMDLRLSKEVDTE